MRTAYSCFVDAHAKFEFQAILWAWSLIRFGRVDPACIHVHVAPGVSSEFCAVIDGFGATHHPGRIFDRAHPHCNKITQLENPVFTDYDQLVLCDCDTVALQPLRFDLGDAVAGGRPTDRANPPLETLIRLYEGAGLIAPGDVAVGRPRAPDERTLATNWNGGLYVLSSSILGVLRDRWTAHAERLIRDEAEGLGEMQFHIDQISFGMALVDIGAAWTHLSEAYNAPLLADDPDGVYPESRVAPILLHHHGRQDAVGFFSPPQNRAYVDAVNQINAALGEFLPGRLLADPEFRSVHAAWQALAEPKDEGELKRAEAAFCNPRYIRHTARRLEHLASLRLPLENRTVLEFGAGIGEHSQFFLDRGCTVISVEPRPQNCAYLRQRPRADERHIIIRASADEAVQLFANQRFEVVYNYGLLYHLDNPEESLEQSAKLCSGLYLLETAVGDLRGQGEVVYDEAADDLTNAVDGRCKLLTRSDILASLGKVLPHAYLPTTQPAHEQFIRDWSGDEPPALNRYRAVFAASVDELDAAMFSKDVLVRYE